ncbi:MAG: CotH kinase family protein [Actinobacteria bacterium]|nr:CotH kinase family protein [Actinomycetota bacterium]
MSAGIRGVSLSVLLVAAPVLVGCSRWTEPPTVVIAEVMALNTSTIADEDGDWSDWIELWNRSSAVVDLTGWQLADTTASWTLPKLALQPDERVIIFASDKDEQHRLHANFKLSAEGEYLSLSDRDGKVVSEFDEGFPPLNVGESYGLAGDNRYWVLINPTPGAPNSARRPTAADKPQLSEAGGYFAGTLSITATAATEGAKLWYTTDGSTPAAGAGELYRGPISISTTTTLRMVATADGWSDSPAASATYLVMDEVLGQTGTPDGWPGKPVNGQVYVFGFDQAYVAEHRSAVEAALLAAPTLSITTDLSNIIDPTVGLYSNPGRSGSEWERPASVELIDGDEGFQINAGIRLKGGYSRDAKNPKHSFRLTFGENYEDVLSYPLFDRSGIQTFSSVDLRTEQNYGWQWEQFPDRNTMLRDDFMRDSQAATGDPSTRSRWVHLFLNGQYWGLYMLRDNVSAHHAAQLSGGSPNDYDVIEHSNDYGYEVNEGDDQDWLQLWSAIEDGRVTDDEFADIAEHTDLGNLADFTLLQIVSGNQDGTAADRLDKVRANNWQAVSGNGQPFRFFLDDNEHVMGAYDRDTAVDLTKRIPTTLVNEFWQAEYFNPGWLHQVLLTRAEYRDIFRARANELLAPDGALATTASLARWVALRDQLDPLVEAEAARWGYAGSQRLGRPQWEAEVEWVERVWFPHRAELVREQLLSQGLIDAEG